MLLPHWFQVDSIFFIFIVPHIHVCMCICMCICLYVFMFVCEPTHAHLCSPSSHKISVVLCLGVETSFPCILISSLMLPLFWSPLCTHLLERVFHSRYWCHDSYNHSIPFCLIMFPESKILELWYRYMFSLVRRQLVCSWLRLPELK